MARLCCLRMGVSIKWRLMGRSRSGKEEMAPKSQEGNEFISICDYYLQVYSSRPHPVTSPQSNQQRQRSKTFEEYEKSTIDAWDEEPGDISQLSSDTQLEFDHMNTSKTKSKTQRM